MSYGLVFGEPNRPQVLGRRSHFVLIDSTHQTNKLSWLLYTLMVTDEYGSWVPGAYIVTAREDSDIIAAGLKQVSTAIFCYYY